MANRDIFTVGGTVQAGTGIYIPRQADEELLNLCRHSTFAYVLTSRQMGKSSLMVRTAEQLSAASITSAIVDLNQLGVQVTAEAWYLGLLTTIEDSLLLNTDVVAWWQQYHTLGITQRLTLFFRDVLLSEVSGRIVIFVDEIDSTLSLDFTDDFFAAIRYLYNARATLPELQRLSFVLVGVATPSDLIDDPKRTPFNIGQRVDLSDFTFKEARPFAAGLKLRRGEALQVLAWALKWTSGHPYLTQRLCQILAGQKPVRWSEAEVDRVVANTFLGEMSEKDHNLQFVRDMMTKRAQDLGGVISLYRAIRQGLYAVSDEDSPEVAHLKLSGIVRRANGTLHVRNPIYATVFNIEWLEEVEAREQIADPRELARLRALAEAQEKQVEAERQRAAEQQRRAEAEHQRATEQQRRAEAERRRAIEQARAEEQAQSANKLRQRAYWLGGALIVAMLALIAAGWLGVQAQFSATAARTAQAQEAGARVTADVARATAQAESVRALNAEATAQAERGMAQAEAIRALDAEATAQAARGVAEGKSIEALDAEATARIEAELADVARATAQSEATRSSEAEATAAVGSTLEAAARATAQAGSTLEAVARATAQAESTRSINAEATARAEAARADQARGTAQSEADRAREAEDEAEDERATAEAESTRAIEAEQTAEAQRAIAETAQAEEAIARETAEAASELATSRQLAARALTLQETRYDLSLLLGLEANRIANTLEARDSLLGALTINSDLMTYLRAHTGGVENAVFRGDGQILASAGDDATIRLWNSSDRRTIQPIGQPLTGHTNKVRALAFSPNGKILASGSDDCTIILWNVEEPQNPELLYQTATTDACPNGATGPPDKVAHFDQVWSLAFNPANETMLVSSSLDGSIILWNVQNPATPQQLGNKLFDSAGEQVFAIAFNPDGTKLASGGCRIVPPFQGCFVGVLYLWDVESRQPLKQFLPLEPGNFYFSIRSVAFSPNGQTLASGGCDDLDLQDLNRLRCFRGDLSFWDVESGQLLAQVFEHTNQVWSLAYSPVENEKLLASGSFDGTVILWNVTNRSNPKPHSEPLEGPTNQLFNQIWTVAFSPKGETLVSGNSDSTISVRDVGGHRLARPLNGLEEPVFSVAFNPRTDMSIVAAGTASGDTPGSITFWNAVTGEKLSAIENLAGTVNRLVFNSDGTLLASVVWDRTITLWNVSNPANPQLLVEFPDAHEDRILTVAFSPDSNLLASGGTDGAIILWNIRNPSAPESLGNQLTRQTDFVNDIVFNPDRRTLAVHGCRPDPEVLPCVGTIYLWNILDPKNPTLISSWDAHNNRIRDLDFSADGNILASGSDDTTIILWDVGSRAQPKKVRTLAGHSQPVTGVVFSPDGETLASSSFGKTVILWDVTTGSQFGNRLAGHKDGVNSMAIGARGRLLASGSFDKTVILWTIDFESWRSLACQVTNRNLTEVEIEQFIPQEFRNNEPACPDLEFPAPASAFTFFDDPMPTVTPTLTVTPSPVPTPAPTETATPTATASPIFSATPTIAATLTPAPTPAETLVPLTTVTPTITPAPSVVFTPTSTPALPATLTPTSTPTPVPTPSPMPTITAPPIFTETPPPTTTVFPSSTATPDDSPTPASATPAPSFTATLTPTPTFTAVPTTVKPIVHRGANGS